MGGRPAARRAFAAGHVAGTLSFDLDGSFATYLGWLIPWGTPLTLLGDTPEQVAEAQRELVRIGIDRPAAAAAGGPAAWAGGQPLRSYPVADFADLEAVRHHRPVVILDVRRDSEWAASHIDGAVHIPLARAARPHRPTCPQVRCGCTARPGTAPRSPRPSSTPPVIRSWPSMMSTSARRG